MLPHPMIPDPILVTGATGYVGGRLVRVLAERGYAVRAMARRPEVLAGRFDPAVTAVAGDVQDPDSLRAALAGVHTAFYLIHAIGADALVERETEQARNFAAAAEAACVRRIVYLGGLTDPTGRLSPHMESRLAVGRVFRESAVETVEFRASIIIGSGSLSFEMIRALVSRLPVMITPRWVYMEAQPIFIGDVIAYLAAALEQPAGPSRIYEIGGADRLSYANLIKTYARIRGLRRLVIPVPVLTPWLSSLWLHLVTPLFAPVGRHLIESITEPSVVSDNGALAAFPIKPLGVEDAIRAALRREDQEFAETHWADALSSTGPVRSWGGIAFGNRLVDARELFVPVSPDVAFRPIQRIGGRTGWYFGTALWRIRGLLDRAVGGVGMGRGRRDRENLRTGDVIDCWRVEAFEPPCRLVLHAEMKLPGRAWLQWEVVPEGDGVRIWQTATFDPVGLLGMAYWYALYPAHELIFAGMLRNIARAALQSEAS